MLVIKPTGFRVNLSAAALSVVITAAPTILAENKPDAPPGSVPTKAPSAAPTILAEDKPDAPPDLVPTKAPQQAPSVTDQSVGPYRAADEPKRKEHHMELFGEFGLWQHPFGGTGISAPIGPVWGVSARAEPFHWLGIRARALRGNQPVHVGSGALGVSQADVHQPLFKVIFLGIRLEPTWYVRENLRLWTGPGLGWARSIVSAPRVGSLNWHSSDRACVYVETQWAIGILYEAVRDVLVLGIEGSAGMLSNQGGTAHQPLQAFTPDGHLTYIGGYPDFSYKLQALLSVGVIF